MRNLFRIAWVAVLELIYEKVFYLLLAFALLTLGLSLMLGQMTYQEQVKLTLDFMLAAIEISMVLFSVFSGISLFQKEMTMGSVSMTLAKPISRRTFLLGKFLGQSIIQAVIISAMAGITLCISSPGEITPAKAVLETITLIYFEVTVVTSITYFFAVNSGAVTTAVSSLCIFCLGHLRESLTQNIDSSYGLFIVWRFAKNLIPDLDVFNTKSIASYGFTLPPEAMMWATVYMLICVFFYLLVASITFERRDIFT